MKVGEVGVGFSQAREKDEFSWQSSHCTLLCVGCFKALSRRILGVLGRRK
jgi:hypothetical protein